MPASVILALALAATSGANSASVCPVERAQYVLRTAPQYTARFIVVDSGRDWPSGLALQVQSEVTHTTYWFLPWNGGSDGRQHLASTTNVKESGWMPPNPDGGPRPLGDLDFFGLDASYRVLDSVPRAHQGAPSHMLVPALGETLWHRSGGTRERPPTQFFDLLACRPSS